MGTMATIWEALVPPHLTWRTLLYYSCGFVPGSPKPKHEPIIATIVYHPTKTYQNTTIIDQQAEASATAAIDVTTTTTTPASSTLLVFAAFILLSLGALAILCRTFTKEREDARAAKWEESTSRTSYGDTLSSGSKQEAIDSATIKAQQSRIDDLEIAVAQAAQRRTTTVDTSVQTEMSAAENHLRVAQQDVAPTIAEGIHAVACKFSRMFEARIEQQNALHEEKMDDHQRKHEKKIDEQQKKHDAAMEAEVEYRIERLRTKKGSRGDPSKTQQKKQAVRYALRSLGGDCSDQRVDAIIQEAQAEAVAEADAANREKQRQGKEAGKRDQDADIAPRTGLPIGSVSPAGRSKVSAPNGDVDDSQSRPEKAARKLASGAKGPDTALAPPTVGCQAPVSPHGRSNPPATNGDIGGSQSKPAPGTAPSAPFSGKARPQHPGLPANVPTGPSAMRNQRLPFAALPQPLHYGNPTLVNKQNPRTPHGHQQQQPRISPPTIPPMQRTPAPTTPQGLQQSRWALNPQSSDFTPGSSNGSPRPQ